MQVIPRRLSRCVHNNESFERGVEYVSHLDLEGNRKDYCLACWEALQKPVEGSFWKGKIPQKKGKVPQYDEKALALFRTSKDPKQRYVLALYLQRKEQLMRRTQTLYEIPETGEVFDVEKAVLSAEETAELAGEIDQLFYESES